MIEERKYSGILTIDINTIKYFLLLFPLVKPYLFDVLPQFALIDMAYNVLKVISFLIIVYLYVNSEKNYRDVFLRFVLFYLLFTLFSTFANGTSYFAMLVFIADVLGFCILISTSRILDELFFCISGLLGALWINLIINSVTVFLYHNQHGISPNTMAELYYLGYDNLHIIYLLPYLSISIFFDLNYYKKIRLFTIVSHIIFAISTVMCMSATTVIVILLFYFIAFLSNSKLVRKLLNEYVIVFATSFVFIFYIIRERYADYLQLFQDLFAKNLRDGRGRIWILYEYAIRSSQKYFIGNGFMDNELRELRVGVAHAHNMYLDLLYEVGIVGLILFVVLIIVAVRKGRIADRQSEYVLLSSVVSFLIGFQVEAYRKTYFIMLLAVIFETCFSYEQTSFIEIEDECC